MTRANQLLRAAMRAKKKPHKYHAKAAVVDGVRFASQAEARRYQELRLLEKAGEIGQLERQPRFQLIAKGGVRVGWYWADFRYWTKVGEQVTEDVKGIDTPLSKWKRSHVEAQYGVTVQIIRRSDGAKRSGSRKGG